MLFEHPAKLQAKELSGRTPLVLAAEMGQEAMARMLVRRGANIFATGRHNGTALAAAVLHGWLAR